MPSPAFAWLPAAAQDALDQRVRPKFDAYFRFASNRSCVRAWHLGNGWLYPNDSVVTDLTVLWSLFCETYEIIKEHVQAPAQALNLAPFFAADQRLVNEFSRIFNEGGEFWESPGGPGTLQQTAQAAAVPARLTEICRTLRNGYAHFHWGYDFLSALDYWTEQGWGTAAPVAAFGLAGRGAGYTAYVADARRPWNAAQFWAMNDLRIFVARSYENPTYAFRKLWGLITDPGEARTHRDATPTRSLWLEEARRTNVEMARRRDQAFRVDQPSRRAVLPRMDEDPALRVNTGGEPGAERKPHAGFGRGRTETARREPGTAPCAHLTLRPARHPARIAEAEKRKDHMLEKLDMCARDRWSSRMGDGLFVGGVPLATAAAYAPPSDEPLLRDVPTGAIDQDTGGTAADAIRPSLRLLAYSWTSVNPMTSPANEDRDECQQQVCGAVGPGGAHAAAPRTAV